MVRAANENIIGLETKHMTQLKYYQLTTHNSCFINLAEQFAKLHETTNKTRKMDMVRPGINTVNYLTTAH